MDYDGVNLKFLFIKGIFLSDLNKENEKDEEEPIIKDKEIIEKIY